MDNRFYSDKKSHSGFREDRSFEGVQWYRVRAHQKQAGEFPTLHQYRSAHSYYTLENLVFLSLKINKLVFRQPLNRSKADDKVLSGYRSSWVVLDQPDCTTKETRTHKRTFLGLLTQMSDYDRT